MSRFYQLPLIEVDPLIKLSEVERALSKVFYPAPSRPTIVQWIEDGTLEGQQFGRGDNWHVFKTSLDNFILNCQRKMAA